MCACCKTVGTRIVALGAVLVALIGCRPEDPPIDVYARFYNAVFEGDHDIVRRSLRRYPSLVQWEFDFGGYQGDVLTTAALGGDPLMVERLLDAGAEPNYHNDMGVTSLMAAVEHGRIDIIQQLIEAGADLSFKAIDGSTVLHYLGATGSIEVADAILPAARSLMIIDEPKDGSFTPLTVALAEYHDDLAFRFIEAGASLERALASAPHIVPEYVIGHHNHMLDYFWEQGVVDPYKVFQSNNLFHYAVWFNNIEFVRELVDRGLWDDSTNHDGETPLQIAERMGRQEIIDIVTEAGLAAS